MRREVIYLNKWQDKRHIGKMILSVAMAVCLIGCGSGEGAAKERVCLQKRGEAPSEGGGLFVREIPIDCMGGLDYTFCSTKCVS